MIIKDRERSTKERKRRRKEERTGERKRTEEKERERKGKCGEGGRTIEIRVWTKSGG